MTENDFELYLDSIAEQKIGQIHTAMPATITSFDASSCTASVIPDFKYYVTDGSIIDFPTISNVPIFMPHAGATQITYPISVGDKCLLVFSERSLDEWMGYTGIDQHDPRRFNLTDAFAFVGMRPTQSIHPSNVELINAGTKVSVTPNNEVNIIGTVNIQGDLTISGTTICQGDVLGGGISLMAHTHPYHHGSTGPSQ